MIQPTKPELLDALQALYGALPAQTYSGELLDAIRLARELLIQAGRIKPGGVA